MPTCELRLVMTASLAEDAHCHPRCIRWREPPVDGSILVVTLRQCHDFVRENGHFSVACHARWLFLIRVTMGNLSLREQVCEAIPPRLLVISRRKWLQYPSELLFVLGE